MRNDNGTTIADLFFWIVIAMLVGLFAFSHVSWADELITDFKEESVPILNEELRKSSENMRTIGSDVSSIDARVTVLESTSVTGTLIAGTPCVQNPVSLATKTTQAHGLGVIPSMIVVYYECLSADLNYAAGDRVTAYNEQSYMGGTQWRADATNVYILTHQINVPELLDGVTPFSAEDITLSKWKVVAVPYKIT